MEWGLQFVGANSTWAQYPATALHTDPDRLTWEYEFELAYTSASYYLAGNTNGYAYFARIFPDHIEIRYGVGVTTTDTIAHGIPNDGVTRVARIVRDNAAGIYKLYISEASPVTGSITKNPGGGTTNCIGRAYSSYSEGVLGFLTFKDGENGTPLLNWSAGASSHDSGTPVLAETVAGKNATGNNMPTDGSAWVYYGEGVDSRDGTFLVTATVSAQFSGIKSASGTMPVTSVTSVSFSGNKVAAGQFQSISIAQNAFSGTKLGIALWPVSSPINTSFNGFKTAFGSIAINAISQIHWLGSSIDIRVGSFNVVAAVFANLSGSKAASGNLATTALASTAFSGTKVAQGAMLTSATTSVSFNGYKTSFAQWPSISVISITWSGLNNNTQTYPNIIQLLAIDSSKQLLASIPQPTILQGIA